MAGAGFAALRLTAPGRGVRRARLGGLMHRYANEIETGFAIGFLVVLGMILAPVVFR